MVALLHKDLDSYGLHRTQGPLLLKELCTIAAKILKISLVAQSFILYSRLGYNQKDEKNRILTDYRRMNPYDETHHLRNEV